MGGGEGGGEGKGGERGERREIKERMEGGNVLDFQGK